MVENRMEGVVRPTLAIPLAAFLMNLALASLYGWSHPADFHLYWLVAHHWADPYDPVLFRTAEAQAMFPKADLQHVHFPYYYPPPAMLLAWPLSKIPVDLSFVLFTGVCAAWLAFLAARRASWLGLLILLSLPMFYGMAIGQLGLAVACAIITAFELIETRPRLAGMILAAVVCIKPQSAIVAPFVLWGRWDTVRAGAIAGIALVLASLVFGPHRWVEWWQSVGRFKTEIEPIVPKIMPYLLFDHALWWRVLLAITGVAFATWERNLTGFLVGTLLCTPYFQLYDLAGFSFLGLLIVADWRRIGMVKGLGVALFGLILVVCPAYSITMTLFCACLIALRLLAEKLHVGRALEFGPPRFLLFRDAQCEATS